MARHRRAGRVRARAIGFFVAYATIDDPRAQRPGRGAGLDRLLRRRQDRARPDRQRRNRESVPLSQVPEHVQDARLAAEDRTFYTNSGIGPERHRCAARQRRCAAARPRAASTITQQYVKNYFLTQDQTLTRKVKEIVISLKIDAAEVQGRDPRELPQHHLLRPRRLRHPDRGQGLLRQGRLQAHRREGALLASVINAARRSTTPASARSRRRNAEARWNYVLDGMVSEGWLDPGGARQGARSRRSLHVQGQTSSASGPNGFITDAVKHELQGQAQADRRRHRPGRPADRHHDRQEGPGRRDRRRHGPDADRAGHEHAAGRPGRDQAR